MTDDSESSLTPAQEGSGTDLADDIAAALEEQAGEDIIGELASASDDPPDTSESDQELGAAGEAVDDAKAA